MGHSENMEMERSRREHEHNSKFGKPTVDNRTWDNDKQEWKKGENNSAMSQMIKAADELRHEGKGSEDPMYENSKKNK